MDQIYSSLPLDKNSAVHIRIGCESTNLLLVGELLDSRRRPSTETREIPAVIGKIIVRIPERITSANSAAIASDLRPHVPVEDKVDEEI